MFHYDRDFVFVFKYSFCHKNTKFHKTNIRGDLSAKLLRGSILCLFCALVFLWHYSFSISGKQKMQIQKFTCFQDILFAIFI